MWPAALAFAFLACGLAWLTALPLWLGDGLASPLTPFVLPVMMTTPAVAALVVTFMFRRWRPASVPQFLGLTPLRPLPRLFAMLGVGFAAAVIVPLIAVAVAAASGALQLDLFAFSGFRAGLDAQLEATGAPSLPMPIEALVLAQVVSIPIGAIINSFLAFGEELGWRGWLLSALHPLGVWPSLLISGAVWGLWHTPLILLGYNFGRPDLIGVGVMLVGCVALGVVFGWLRLRAGNIWPVVLAHGAFNAAAGLSLLVAAATPEPSQLALSPLSWPGWIACTLVVVVVIVSGQFRVQRLQRVSRPREA